MCGLPRGDLLVCSWGFGLYHVHAVPRRDLLGDFGGCGVCELPRGELLDCSWGFVIYHVLDVPRRQLLGRSLRDLHGVPGVLVVGCREWQSRGLCVQFRLL